VLDEVDIYLKIHCRNKTGKCIQISIKNEYQSMEQFLMGFSASVVMKG